PDDILKPLVEKYWKWGYNDARIRDRVLEDVDVLGNNWSLGTHTIRRRRLAWGLLSARQQGHTVQSIKSHMMALRAEFTPKPPGVKRTQDWLRTCWNEMVPRSIVQRYNHIHHPDEVKQRRAHHFQSKTFFAAGLFHLVCFDQHDKWVRFGLFMHIGVEPFSGAILWLKIWWTNHNPRLILSYYLDMARAYGGIPLLTQSDLGSENNGIAKAHSVLRQLLDPTLEGTLQHNWKPGHGNIKPEAKWSQVRREFSPGCEAMLDQGLHNRWYNPSLPLDHYLFRWLAIPFLQAKLDNYVEMYNSSKPRPDKKKVIPVGIPNEILQYPARWRARNFMVHVKEEDISYVEKQWAPPDHPVFELVPTTFDLQCNLAYQALGAPAIDKESFWSVFLAL
ncbi:hypothetical protein CALVIDRAFT_464988, partial [Calocera viscosa TUFC12733]